MSKRIYLYWTPEEIECLKTNYGIIPQEELTVNLRNRKWKTIVGKAKKLGLRHQVFAKKKADLTILLQ